MDSVIDVLSAALFGGNPTSTVGFLGIAAVAGAFLISGSWVFLWIAILCRAIGALAFYIIRWSVRRRSAPRKKALLAQVAKEQEEADSHDVATVSRTDNDDWEKLEAHALGSSENGQKASAETEWAGVVGFLHPFCNAGGGGERVLWAAIKAIQERYPKAVCVVYTGDHESSKSMILQRVSKRFSIHLHAPTVHFLYLNTRQYVVASSWPNFTLLGQAVGSIAMGWDALSLLVPDIFVDTMGHAFSTAFCKLAFPRMPIGAYVHYPFIGTHMVDSLDSETNQGINAGTGKGLRGLCKRLYWRLLVAFYILAGRSVDIVMANSSWTRAHMARLWGANRRHEQKTRIEVVFPPVAVEEIVDAIPLEGPYVQQREKNLLYIAQFRPEKDHELILTSFARMLQRQAKGTEGSRLVLIGSARDSEDETLVYKLRLLTKELKIEEKVDFKTKDVSWPEVLDSLKKSWVGVNGMWCEHFGIGVVEYQAAGLISVVNDSGGPKQDIVTKIDGGTTGKMHLSFLILAT